MYTQTERSICLSTRSVYGWGVYNMNVLLYFHRGVDVMVYLLSERTYFWILNECM